jgi:hypothetical protein
MSKVKVRCIKDNKYKHHKSHNSYIDSTHKCKIDGWNNRAAAAASALGKIGDERAVEPLVSSLQHLDGDLRVAAAKALVRFYHKSGISPKNKELIYQQREIMAQPRKRISTISEHSDKGIVVDLIFADNFDE